MGHKLPSKAHSIIGLIFVIPIFIWVATGSFFLIKPGYKAAYEKIELKTYPLHNTQALPSNTTWQKVQVLQTVLGAHLLVDSGKGWVQLNTNDYSIRSQVNSADTLTLLNDAITFNPERYGQKVDIHEGKYITDTGIVLSLNWDSMTVYQRGPDTELISFLYKLHYLQWFNHKTLDTVLGILGLSLLLLLMILGTYSYFKKSK